ncbi:MAG: bifunctional 4-hydroxy-2-oxoglutarate aldolase/2-dehydro-3-deoxy-phosphogluconate aldolase [Chloroflexi bacterium]|nr:bifunctional 4-hydroxy-2-oxoglutarate aldolase/2-dehydro-3-deoxy-phosphogluconate aldolase [Chloroflexota bacterium]
MADKFSEADRPSVTWIEDTGITAVVRLDDLSSAQQLADALLLGGVRCVEFTLTNRHAIDVIGNLVASHGDRLLIGAGTVLDPESARAAITAGAQFVVTPTLRLSTIELCRRYGIAIICGAFSPTEILTAWEAGANWVKLFPASVGGPRYLREVLAPLPQVRIVPTGGVSLENAAEFLAAGAVALAVGSNLVKPELVNSGQWEAITQNARSFISIVVSNRRP